MKTCSFCNLEKEKFVKNTNKCKDCQKEYQKIYRDNHQKELLIKRQEYYKNNIDNILSNKNNYYNNNRNQLLDNQKQYYYDNIDYISIIQKEYRQNNKEKIRIYQNTYTKNRRKNDSIYKLKCNCSRLIHHVLKNEKKNLSFLKYIDYTIKELKQHLESLFDENMSWENYGSYWHIDHIYPQSLLPYTNMADDNFKKCWALNNLRPLEKSLNMKKGSKLVSDV